MNALDKYRHNLHSALQDLLERTRQHQANVGFRRASGNGNTFTPASTSEEIAMVAIELSSRARTLEEAVAVVKQQYDDLFRED